LLSPIGRGKGDTWHGEGFSKYCLVGSRRLGSVDYSKSLRMKASYEMVIILLYLSIFTISL
jgi:hypothetical protein